VASKRVFWIEARPDCDVLFQLLDYVWVKEGGIRAHGKKNHYSLEEFNLCTTQIQIV